jgi:hypothetical protein
VKREEALFNFFLFLGLGCRVKRAEAHAGRVALKL